MIIISVNSLCYRYYELRIVKLPFLLNLFDSVICHNQTLKCITISVLKIVLSENHAPVYKRNVFVTRIFITK